MNRISTIAGGLLLAASLVFAQGPSGSGNGNQPQPAGSGLNMAKLQVVEGTINSVQVAYGVQYPSIVVNKLQIKVAPVWYMLENDFELKAGEAVRVSAAPSNTASDPYLYAVDITKTASGAKITLRNSLGIPLWLGAARQGGQMQAPRSGGSGIDSATVATVSGTIESVTASVGNLASDARAEGERHADDLCSGPRARAVRQRHRAEARRGADREVRRLLELRRPDRPDADRCRGPYCRAADD